MVNQKITALAAQAEMEANDLVPVADVSVPSTEKMELEEFRDSVRWLTIPTSRYTAAPASTSQLNMSDTTGFKVGLPVRYKIGGIPFYGMVTAVVASTSITVAGASLSAALEALALGMPEGVVQRSWYFPGSYGGVVQDILDAIAKQYTRWDDGKAFLVAFQVRHKTNDTGAAQPKINLKVAGSLVSTNDTNNGIQPSAGAWVANPAIAISTANYAITRGQDVEVRVTAAGTNGNAADLTVQATFVKE